MRDASYRHLRVNAARLVERLDALAEIGSTGDGGCARLALTDEDRAGRDLVVTWMSDLGLNVAIDAIGNVVAHWGGAGQPPIMAGSHIDTVRTGGRYDGNLGVLAGLEVLEAVIESGWRPRRPLAVAVFTNEEGARFPPDMLGSLTYAGGMAIEDALDITGIDGTTVGDELRRIGYVGPNPCPGAAPHAYVELHIEQGPVLEAEGTDIGVVEGVQGISWQELTIHGQANHAGTTPMTMRHDAGYAAARIATFVRELATEIGPPMVGTVGLLQLRPDLVNVVAARATLTVDRDQAAAVGGGPRRPDAGPGLPGRDGVRREHGRHQPQPGRVHRTRRSGRRRRRPAPGHARVGRVGRGPGVRGVVEAGVGRREVPA